MSVHANRALYYVLRACLALLGLFLLESSLFSLLYADVIYSESSRPPWHNVLLDVAFLLYGSLLLVPFGWLRQSPLFQIRMVVFALGVLWAAYVGLSGLGGLAQGRKSWLILPGSAVLFVLTLIAPLALLMRRKQYSVTGDEVSTTAR